MILLGDCMNRLKELEANSVDAVITDAPYGLKFMGKKWDTEVPSADMWREVFRVMKPGGHLLSFGGTRTYHHMAMNIELAGFEIRDQLQWLYGSGFPKSHNLPGGIGTALKPANEPIVLARKPLSEKTVAANVLKWGVGGLNIDESRIAGEKRHPRNYVADNDNRTSSKFGAIDRSQFDATQGRWPANLLLDEEAAAMLDEQSGFSSEKARICKVKPNDSIGTFKTKARETKVHGDSGGASRFFYCAKTSKSERNAGLEGMAEKDRPLAISQWENQTNGSGEVMGPSKPQQNHHPTVKPLKLMEYLIKLITPPGGVVLDPFMGSGSTGVAAFRLGYKFIGIEMNEEYVAIAEKRIEHVKNG